MKKLLTFLFALMMMSTLTFGAGNYFVWTGIADGTSWNVPGNWAFYPGSGGVLPSGEPGGLPVSTYPGQNPLNDGDWAVFDNGLVNLITNVPTCTIGLLQITLFPGTSVPTFVLLTGIVDGNTMTIKTPTFPYYLWQVQIEEGCFLDLNQPNRVKMVCDPGAHFWHKNNAFFYPADYSNGSTTCDSQNKGFILKSTTTNHAEFIQQIATTQPVKGWAEYDLDDSKYHYICPPITSEFTAEFLPNNKFCRTANCLCIFDRDYVRKYSNGIGWDNWLGNMATCWDPQVDITTGRGYEYYGNPLANPGGKYAFYGTFNSGNPITLPVNSAGWNLVGNPYPSAITFGEPSGAPTAGVGWTWNAPFTDPAAYWWDNSLPGYRYYNWFIGIGTPGSDPRAIARSQGFFVHVTTYAAGAGGSDVSVGNQARVFRGARQIGKSVIANNMSLTLNDASSKSIDDAVINFREDANGTEFNGLLDAYKIFNEYSNVSQLYFKTTNDVAAALKTLKLETGNVMYPLYMKVVTTGTYSIDAKNITSFSANTGIILKDNKTNTTVDLKVNPFYTFTATAGDDDARFGLYFTDVLYGINNLNDNTYKVYSYDNSIYIQNNDPKSTTGTVVVYDMIGKQMIQENLNSMITRINTNLNTGFYIVSVKTDKGVYNQKVYIN